MYIFAGMKVDSLISRLLIWRVRHISNKSFVLILSAVVGIIAGLAAVFLKTAVHLVQRWLAASTTIGLVYLLYPLLGILITVTITHFFLKQRLGHGITDILYSIAQKSSILARSKMYSRIITSIFTVGFGGSAGLEAPSVVTGGAIGSNIGAGMHLGYKKRTLMIGCGAAGAVAAIFNAPVAGVIFSLEVILTEVTISSFIPLLISSISATLVSLVLLGGDTLFSFRLQDPFIAADIPAYLLLGVACGMVSLIFIRVTGRVEDWVGKIKAVYTRALTGGLMFIAVVALFPAVYGEGYAIIKQLLNGNDLVLHQNPTFRDWFGEPWFFLLYLAVLILAKIVATALTIGAGGSGGIFGPSLVVGGLTGFFMSRFFNTLTNAMGVSESNFTLVGMCGLMSGVQFAPLTAIFMIAEITGGYTLFVPLMAVSAISFITVQVFEPHSIYTKRLIERGDLITHDKDRHLLSLIRIDKLIETDYYQIGPEATLGDLVKLVRLSRRNLFPVVNSEQQLVGIITLDDIRKIMFDEEMQQTVKVKSLMHQSPAEVSSGEGMAEVMQKFETTGAWNLPVIDEGTYIGFVSKSTIFNAYRKKLIRQSKE
jgi:chloride channel protein, CIC family